MAKSLKQFFAHSEVNGGTLVPVITPLNVKLEQGKVLDIYKIAILFDFAATAAVIQFILGLTNCRVARKTEGALTSVKYEEFMSRKYWITRRLYRYTTLGESSFVGFAEDFCVPYTVWDTPHFIHVHSAEITVAHVDCEVHGIIREASKAEMDDLQISQRPVDLL